MTQSVPVPYIADNIISDILIIGGGITGITAAIESSKAKYKTVLIEKDEKIGGWANILYKQLPQHEPYTKIEEPVINDKITTTILIPQPDFCYYYLGMFRYECCNILNLVLLLRY